MRIAFALVLATVAQTRVAWADERDLGFRTIGASARALGCTSWVALSCEAATSLRVGVSVIDVMWRTRNGSGPLTMVLLAGRPDGGFVTSHMITAAGWRQRVGRGWVQGGPGIAVRRVATRTARAAWLLEEDAGFALVGGAGLTLTIDGRGFDVAIDVGKSVEDAEHYQVTASITSHRF